MSICSIQHTNMAFILFCLVSSKEEKEVVSAHQRIDTNPTTAIQHLISCPSEILKNIGGLVKFEVF